MISGFERGRPWRHNACDAWPKPGCLPEPGHAGWSLSNAASQCRERRPAWRSPPVWIPRQSRGLAGITGTCRTYCNHMRREFSRLLMATVSLPWRKCTPFFGHSWTMQCSHGWRMPYGRCGRCHTNCARATPRFCPFIIIGHSNFDLLVNHIMFWPYQLWKPSSAHECSLLLYMKFKGIVWSSWYSRSWLFRYWVIQLKPTLFFGICRDSKQAANLIDSVLQSFVLGGGVQHADSRWLACWSAAGGPP